MSGIDVVKVINALRGTQAKEIRISIIINKKNKLPIYRSPNRLCSTCKKVPLANRECERFYDSLPLGSGDIECPFGVQLEFIRDHCLTGPIEIYLQRGISSTHLPSKYSSLPRVQKKALSKAYETVSTSLFHMPEDYFMPVIKDIIEAVNLGKIAYSINALAHEIHTPLQGAMGASNAIKTISGDFVETTEPLNILNANLSELESLSKKIQLLFSEKVNFVKSEIRRVVVHDIVAEIRTNMNDIARRNKISIKTGYNSGQRIIEGVPDQVRLALSCLIENAIKYSYRGFSDKDTTVDIAYNSTQNYLEISVKSIGCIIHRNEIEEGLLFNLGYRGKMSGDRNRTGTGSGLYIVNKIAESHKGYVNVESHAASTHKDGPRVNTFTLGLPFVQ